MKKKRIWLVACVMLLGLADAHAQPLFKKWYFNPNGTGPGNATLINDYLDLTGFTYVENTMQGSGPGGTFTAHAVFYSQGHDNVPWPPPPPINQVTATFDATGTFDNLDNGTFTFDQGTLNIYSDPNHNYSTTDSIYGADDGFLIGTWILYSGSGKLENAVPNGVITVRFVAQQLAPGYWFTPDRVDMSTFTFPTIAISLATTNASYVEEPEETVVNEFREWFDPNLPDNSTPPFKLWLSTNGQYRVGVVPEPATLFLLGSGLAGLAGFARRRKTRSE